MRKIVSREDLHDYWISKTKNSELIDKRFPRQELLALNNQFE